MKAAFAVASFVLFAVLVCWPQSPSAVPAFARHYGANCTMCHSSFPRLNDFGARFRDNGYRLPGLEERSTTILEGPPPFAARTSVGFNVDRYDGSGGADLTRMQVNGLDLLSAGLIGRNVGYLVIYPPPLPESPVSQGQSGDVEMANVIFSEVVVPELHVRAGRFEPAYVAFSVKRRLSVAPYEIYDFAQPGGYPLSDTQDGLEVTATPLGSLSLALGYIDGSATNPLEDMPADVYVRASAVIGAGEGQTAGQRIGVTGQFGTARPDPTAGVGGGRETFFRVGLDASLNLGHGNLALQGLWSRDAAAFWGLDGDVNVFGGFAELTYPVMTQWLLLARYDAVITPDELSLGTIMRGTGAVRFSLEDNLALHAEYSFRTQEAREPATDDLTEHHGTLRVDWAF